MTEYMSLGFQTLIEEMHTLTIDQIAVRLYHICGSCRYLQLHAYLIMPHLTYLVDPARSKLIFTAWTYLMLQDMDNTCSLVRDACKRICIPSKHIYASNSHTIWNVWLIFHMEKDSWYSFRNKHLCCTSHFIFDKMEYSGYRSRCSSYNRNSVGYINVHQEKQMNKFSNGIDQLEAEDLRKLSSMFTDSIKRDTPAVCNYQINRVSPHDEFYDYRERRHVPYFKDTHNKFRSHLSSLTYGVNTTSSENKYLESINYSYTDHQDSISNILLVMMSEQLKRAGKVVTPVPGGILVTSNNQVQSEITTTITKQTQT